MGPPSRRESIGKKLSAKRDRVIGDYRIASVGTNQRAKQRRLLPMRDLLNAT